MCCVGRPSVPTVLATVVVAVRPFYRWYLLTILRPPGRLSTAVIMPDRPRNGFPGRFLADQFRGAASSGPPPAAAAGMHSPSTCNHGRQDNSDKQHAPAKHTNPNTVPFVCPSRSLLFGVAMRTPTPKMAKAQMATTAPMVMTICRSRAVHPVSTRGPVSGSSCCSPGSVAGSVPSPSRSNGVEGDAVAAGGKGTKQCLQRVHSKVLDSSSGENCMSRPQPGRPKAILLSERGVGRSDTGSLIPVLALPGTRNRSPQRGQAVFRPAPLRGP